MAETLLVGNNVSSPIDGTGGANRIYGTMFSAVASGRAKSFFSYTVNAARTIAPGIYDASYNLLWNDPSGTSCATNDWVETSIGTSIDIVSSTGYGLCANSNGTGAINFTNNASADGFYEVVSYGTWNDPLTPISLERDYMFYVTGYPLPTITSIDGDNDIDTDQTGVNLVGTNLLDDVDNPALWLCSTSDFATSPIKVSQTVNSSSDTGINFDVVQGGLSAGTVYAFVETGRGQINATPFAVTLSAAGGASDTLLGLTFSHSILTMSAVSAVADAPQAVSFSHSLIELGAVSAVSDIPQAVTFSFSLLTLGALSEITDTPQSIDFTSSILEMSATSAITDAPQTIEYSYTIEDIDAESSIGAEDTLIGLDFSYSLLSMDAESAITDSPQTLTYSYAISDIDAGAVLGASDNLLGLSFNSSILELSAISTNSDSPEGLSFSYDLLEIAANAGYSDTPQGISFASSIADVEAVSAVIDALETVQYAYSIATIDAGPEEEIEEDDIIWNKVRRIILKQISYGSSDVQLAFDMPHSWDVELLTGVTVQIADRAGNELLAADACTLYTETELNAAAYQFEDQITLAATATDPVPGEMLTIIGVGAQERVIVKEYDSTAKIAKLEALLQNDFESGAAVFGNTVEYNLDISDTDTFTAGKHLVATWTPTGTGTPIKTILQVTKFEADTSDIERRFQVVYPRAYEAFTTPRNRFDQMVAEAQAKLEVEMLAEKMDYHRIVGESILPQLLMAMMARLWLLQADEDLQDEREQINSDYVALFGVLKNLPIWTDHDQDGIQNETTGEVTSHHHIFGRSW